MPVPGYQEFMRPLLEALTDGREKNVREVYTAAADHQGTRLPIRRLRDGAPERMLVILGASGAGKSSFLRAGLSKDETRVLTWSVDQTARLWNAATGAQIRPALTHEDEVVGAAFSKDETRVLTWSIDKTARLWNVRWAMRDPADPDFVADICREKLVGTSVRAAATPSAAQLLVGVRNIDKRDTVVAPILRGREGESVCSPPPTTWETLRSLLWSPAR